jgi:hypothetical protein
VRTVPGRYGGAGLLEDAAQFDSIDLRVGMNNCEIKEVLGPGHRRVGGRHSAQLARGEEGCPDVMKHIRTLTTVTHHL